MTAPKRPRGRPRTDPEPRTKSLLLRLTEDEHAELARAAERDDRPVAAWIRRLALAAARTEARD